MMRKKRILIIMLLFCACVLQAQGQDDAAAFRLEPRSNIISYDEENDIEKLRYRESPYYLSLTAGFSESSEGQSKSYVRTIHIPKDWKGFQSLISLQASPGYALWVNEKYAGVCDDWRAVTYFDVTSLLKYGKSNVLSIRKQGEHDGDFLEVLRPESAEGITGDVALLLKPEANVSDFTINATYSAGMGTFEAHVDVFNRNKKGRYFVEVELWNPAGHVADKFGKWISFDKRSGVTVTVGNELANVSPWTSETPKLYTAVIRLRDESMDVVDVVGARFGFRTVEILDGLLTVNGSPITLKGMLLKNVPMVNDKAGRDRLRASLLNLKKNNINAIRAVLPSPADCSLFELCDELGLYVVCDANLQPASDQGRAVATDNEYADLFTSRVDNMYGALKNHTSIIVWSLGEGRDNGVCMTSAYRSLKQKEKNRPVLYSGAQYAENTDLIAPLCATSDMLNQYMAKPHTRPMVMLSYGSAKGNNMGGMEDFWTSIRNHSKLQGGFFDSWNDIEGKPYLQELKYIYRPIDISLLSTSVDEAVFSITNLCDFAQLGDFQLDYVICTNLKNCIVEGDVSVALKPGKTDSFRLKVPKLTLYAGEELVVVFRLKTRMLGVLPKGFLLYETQFALPSQSLNRQPMADYDRQPLSMESIEGANTPNSVKGKIKIYNNSISLLYDLDQGCISSLCYRGLELLRQAPHLNFWRAATDNDRADPNGSRMWQQLAPENLQWEVVAANCRRIDDYSVGIDVMLRYSNYDNTPLFDVRQTYMVLHSGDVLISNDIQPTDAVKALGKVGMQMGLSKSINSVEWYGQTGENYSDRSHSGLLKQQKAEASSLFYKYDKPQESGNRINVRWLAVRNDAIGLYVDMMDTLFNFSIYPYNDQQLFASHTYEGLKESPYWTFNADLCQSGIGSALSGDNVQGKDLLRGRHYHFVLHLRPYDCLENDAQDFYRISYPKVESGVLDMPIISKSKDRFDGPMQISLHSKAKGSEIRYTLDGTIPTESSALYKGPITITNSTLVSARSFKKGASPSFTASRQFTFDYVVSTTFAHKPSAPYNKNVDKALFDGELGEANDLSRGWLGFSGRDLSVTVQLGKSISMEEVSLRFAHVPDAWAFAPASVTVSVSSDGINYSKPYAAKINYNAASVDMNATQLQVIHVKVDESNVKYVRVEARSIGRIPDWHRAKGLKPWIMIDEIQVVEKL